MDTSLSTRAHGSFDGHGAAGAFIEASSLGSEEAQETCGWWIQVDLGIEINHGWMAKVEGHENGLAKVAQIWIFHLCAPLLTSQST